MDTQVLTAGGSFTFRPKFIASYANKREYRQCTKSRVCVVFFAYYRMCVVFFAYYRGVCGVFRIIPLFIYAKQGDGFAENDAVMHALAE